MARRRKKHKLRAPGIPEEEILRASCYLMGHNRNQDAIFDLRPDNTVRVIVQDGRVGCRDEVLSVRRAYSMRKYLLQKGWRLVDKPRRSEEQLRRGIEAARRSFAAQSIRRVRRPLDPESNMTPPEKEMLRQRERIGHSFAAANRYTRVIPGGAIEMNKRRH